MEHGKILFRREMRDWKEVADAFLNFPSSLVHDDALDALAYVAQLMEGRVFNRFAEAVDEPYWECQDSLVGY
jgi:hypothetical protein